jgi:hypothetical protein
MKNKEKVIDIKPIVLNTIRVRIEGDSDLILNKMNRRNRQTLVDKQRNKSKTIAEPNMWEDLITAMHWRDGEPTDYTEEGMKKALTDNAPCITTFGLKKSFEEAIVRNGIDTYATKFKNGVNIIAPHGLAPVKFGTHRVEEKLISAKKGSPVLSDQNIFSEWSAEFDVQFTEGGAYSAEQIIQIIGLAGFGGGIGSGRTSGYGRYHVSEVLSV